MKLRAWIVAGIATIVAFIDDAIHFLPEPGGDRLYLIIIVGAIIYLLVKHAVKEALEEK